MRLDRLARRWEDRRAMRLPIETTAREIPIPKWGLDALQVTAWLALLLIAVVQGQIAAFALFFLTMWPGGWI